MTRSGYSDDCENLNLYRGNVDRAIRGHRGQVMLKALLKALDAMPDKRLIANDLVRDVDNVCAIGAWGRAQGFNLNGIAPDDHNTLGRICNVAKCLIAEIEYVNDEEAPSDPALRWKYVRDWVSKQIGVST